MLKQRPQRSIKAEESYWADINDLHQRPSFKSTYGCLHLEISLKQWVKAHLFWIKVHSHAGRFQPVQNVTKTSLNGFVLDHVYWKRDANYKINMEKFRQTRFEDSRKAFPGEIIFHRDFHVTRKFIYYPTTHIMR